MAEGGNVLTRVARDEHQDAALAKRSLMIGFDGTNFQIANMDSSGNIIVSEEATTGIDVTVRNTNFSGVPFVFNINALLGVNATEFLVINDGNGDFSVARSVDGSVFGGEHVLERDEPYARENVSVHTLRLTLLTVNSSYRILAS